jgi:hypothetical protein
MTTTTGTALASVLLQIEDTRKNHAASLRRIFRNAKVSIEASGHPCQTEALETLTTIAKRYSVQILD